MKNKREHIWERLSNNLTPCKLPLFVVFEVETSLFFFKLLLHDFFSCFSRKLLNFFFLSSIFWSLKQSLSTTSNMDCQLLCQKLIKKSQYWKHKHQVFLLSSRQNVNQNAKTKYSSENTSFYVSITENFWWDFWWNNWRSIFEVVERLCLFLS